MIEQFEILTQRQVVIVRQPYKLMINEFRAGIDDNIIFNILTHDFLIVSVNINDVEVYIDDVLIDTINIVDGIGVIPILIEIAGNYYVSLRKDGIEIGETIKAT